MSRLTTPRSIGTHDGSFHADEVTACALLILFSLIDRGKIHRTRDPAILKQCEYICDVGGVYDSSDKQFDHHQVEYKGAMSSAGMILLHLKEIQKIDEREYEFFNQALIKGVDDHDNGKDPQIPGLCTYSHVIANFNVVPHDAPPERQDAAFMEALDFAVGNLKRLWKRYDYIKSCREVVAHAMKSDNTYLIFNESIPWLELFFELGGNQHPASFIIMPSGQHWKLRGIPPTFDERMKVRQPLPEEWGGLLDTDLKKVTGIPGAIFCHKGRFISVWETKDDALKALQLVLNKKEK